MTSVAIFCFAEVDVDIDVQMYLAFDKFRQFIKKELGEAPFFISYKGDADEEFIKAIRQNTKKYDAIIFIVDDEQFGKYLYGLGLGDGVMIEKLKPVLFVYAGKEDKRLKNDRFMLRLGDLSDDAIKMAALYYLKNDMKNFWVNYARSVVNRFNKTPPINLEMHEDTMIATSLAGNHPCDYSIQQLDIVVTNAATRNFHEFSDFIFVHQFRTSVYVHEEPAMTIPLKLFISYSKHDQVHKDTLLKHLAGLRRQDKIVTWNDHDLLPGEEWDARIKQELGKADIVLYLVSADSMATDYIQNIELPLIEARCQKGECKLVPVIVRHCDWLDLDFAKYYALPSKGKPVKAWDDEDEAWLEVVKGIKRIVT